MSKPANNAMQGQQESCKSILYKPFTDLVVGTAMAPNQHTTWVSCGLTF